MKYLASMALLLFGSAFADTTLIIELGQDESGRPTETWLRAVSRFNDEQALLQLSQMTEPFSIAELKWIELITTKASTWPARIKELNRPFSNTTPPETVSIILGNMGGNDAFIAEGKNIAFDLARMQFLYGAADSAANDNRIDRFFSHEFTHLLHREWRRVHQPTVDSPLEIALWVCLAEGLGNLYSLSARWTDENGKLSLHAQDVLARLQPTFVERLSLLNTASEAQASELMQGMSMGPFEEKWGALPVALWLSQEVQEDDDALRTWVDAGPWGIIELATKHLPSELAAQLPVRKQSENGCSP